MKGPVSLQGQLLALMMGTLAIVWTVTAIATWRDTRHELDELLDSHLTQAAALLVARQAHDLDEDDIPLDAPTLHKYAPKVAFQVFHEDALLLRSANAPVLPMVAGPVQRMEGFTTAVIDGALWRIFGAHGNARDVQVFVGERLDARDAISWAVVRATLWPMLLALPVIALGVWWAVRRGTLPLRQLSHTLAARQPNALLPVVLERAPSEIALVLHALNGLFARIAALMASERRFTADAAHELRTPIAAIRVHAEVAQQETDEARRQQALQYTLQGCDRTTHLVAQLLTLSRLETSESAPLQTTDLRALARQAMADLAPASNLKQQTMTLVAPDESSVRGDDTLLQVLLRNLLDNAIRYSPEQATITVTIHTVHGQQVLTVEDSGSGLEDAHLQRLGERFYRPAGTASPGSGLGLSIVRRIAQVHGATLAIERSAALGGLACVVRFPAHQQP
jgi:two-component system sensor histidine kinase QseC